ncbi:MAG: type II toxin-antitoxin system antitoxin SocA domain-containing protein [Patescibacteria group bacterium]
MSKKEEFKELIWYIAANHPRMLKETKLWKLCFFSEADYFEKFNERLTSVSYIKNTFGPTPINKIAQKAIEELVSENLLTITDGNFIGAGEMELKFLDAKKIQSIENTCLRYSELNVNQIVHLAHQDPVYLMADYHHLVDFENAQYRSNEEDVAEEPEEVSLNKLQKTGLFALAA